MISKIAAAAVVPGRANGAAGLLDWVTRLVPPRSMTAPPALIGRYDAHSERAAMQVPAPSLVLDDGKVERRVHVLRPMERAAPTILGVVMECDQLMRIADRPAA